MQTFLRRQSQKGRFPSLVQKTLEGHRSDLASINKRSIQSTGYPRMVVELRAVERALKTGQLGKIPRTEIARVRGNIEDEVGRCNDQIARNVERLKQNPGLANEIRILQARARRGQREMAILGKFI